MLTDTQKNEFDVLKSQMQVLKSHLSDSEIVSSEMLDAAIKSSAQNLTSRRLWNVVAIVVVLLLVGYMSYVCLGLHKCSVMFMVATVVWCLFLAVVNFIQYKENIRGQLLDGSIADTVDTVSRWKLQNFRQGVSIAVATVIWSAFCLCEVWDDIISDPSHAVFVAVLYIFVLGYVGGHYRRVHKVTTSLLKQMDELR
ncbi:MAG TPA: hypothetical protein DDX40_09540 [Rikenellaceae bacterium]|nr:hypothetical protein [Rikenellaceae bacterium]